MQSLGDFLPEENRSELADDNFKVGAVLKYHMPFTNPPKEKRAIIVGFDAEKVLFALILINTEVNPRIFNTQELRDLHLQLEETGRPYLNHLSHVDCSQIFEQDIEQVKEILKDSPGVHIGNVGPSDFENIREKISSATTITPKLKRKYGFI
jgi:hypothetical protein